MAIKFLSSQSITGELTVSTISVIGSDTDKFLMSDGGVIKYVTGATLLSYIGAGTSSTDYYVTSTGFNTSTGTLTLVRVGLSTLSQNLDGRYLELTGGTLTGAVTIQASSSNPLLNLYNTSNGSGSTIQFSDQTGQTQVGNITFYHSDGVSQGGGASWHFVSEPDTVLVVGSSTVNGRFVAKSAGSVAEVDYGFYDDVNTGMYRGAADTVRLVGGGVYNLSVSATNAALYYQQNLRFSTTNDGASVAGGLVIAGATDALLDLNQTGTDTGWSYINFKTLGTRNYYVGQDSSKNFNIFNDNIDVTAISVSYASNLTTIGGDLTVSGGDITLGGTGRIQGVDTVSSNTDAANKLYVDTAVAGVPQGDITGVVAGTSLTGGGTSGSVTLNADTSELGHIVDSANATVGPGWITVAEAYDTRKAGEVYVTDGDSGDHTYIRIEWMRSYQDSNFTVLNCGGHSNRITGVRVLEEDADNTYGQKFLQVYVTASSNYYVIVVAPGTIPNYGDLTAITPIVENTITGYSAQGATLEDLQNSSIGTNQGVTVGTDLWVDGGDIVLGGTGRIQGIDTVTSGTDATSKTYVDTAVSGVPQGTVTGSGVNQRVAYWNSASGITSTNGFTFNGNSFYVPNIIYATGGNSTEWNTAYTYSQVGHLPLAGGTLTGALTGTSATFSGNATATTFLGDLNGTINTLTTAVTKANATSDTTVATTAFVQNLIGTIPAGLVFQGTWNAATNTPTLTSGSGTTGHFYIVSTDGSTNLDGITDWVTGDWAVFVEQGATDAWEKVDNSSVLDGSGTGQKVTLWSGSGTSNTLTDAPITVSGNNATFAGTVGSGAITSTGKITGTELEGTSLDINGNADIAGNLVVDGGNIVIDTDAAGASLTWKESDGTTIAGQLRGYNNRGDIYLYNDGTKTTELSAQSDSFIPALHIGGTAGASGGVLQTTGNVNIGGDADISGDVTISGSTKDLIIANDAETQAGIVFIDNQAPTDQAAAIKFDCSTETLDFFVNDETAERMSINTSGVLTLVSGSLVLSGTGRIQGVDTVSSGTDAANKTYVDNAVAGVPQGDITNVSTTSPITGGGSSGSVTIAHANSGATAGNYTNANVTVDATGHITSVSSGSDAEGVTSVATSGTVSGLTLTGGTITSTGTITLGGTLSLTSANVTSGLGFTPYNATNPANYTSNTGTTTASNTQTFTNKSGSNNQWTNDAGYITSASLPTVNNSTITVTTGTGLDGATSFTLNQAAAQTIALSLDLNELGAGGTLIATDSLVAVNGTTNNKQVISSIPLSIFNNNLGWTTNTGTTTASNTQTFTNKSGNISQWTNDSGYATANTNIGSINLSVPAATSRTLTLGSSSTLSILNSSGDYLSIFSASNVYFGTDVIVAAASTTASLLKLRGISSNGSTAISLRAPDTFATGATYILPQLPGSANKVLSSTTTGTMSWVSAGAGTVTSVGTGQGLTGGAITGSGTVSPDYAGGSNIILATTDGSGTTLDVNDKLLYSDGAEDVKFCNVDDLPFSTTPSDVGLSSISSNGNVITGQLVVTSNAFLQGSVTVSSTLYVPSSIAHTGDTTTKMEFTTGQWTVSTSGSQRLQCSSSYTRVNQNFVCTGNITAYFSDERLKTKTGNIENALDKINSLEGFTYVENDLAKSLGFDNKKQQVGLSAQSVNAVLPEAVGLAPIDYLEDKLNDDGEYISKSGKDYLTVDYSKLVPLLIEAVKELTSEVADLKRKLK